MRLVTFIVRFYPPRFREQFATEIQRDVSRMGMTPRLFVDLVRSVFSERRLSRMRGDAPRRRGWRMGSFGQDMRLALRQVARNPGFAAAVVLTLSLSLGGVTAVFAIADPLLFRALPYADSDRIVELSARGESGSFWLYQADLLALQRNPGAFEAVADGGAALYLGRLASGDSPDAAVTIGGVSRGFFDVFGVRPARGRVFTSEEYDANARVVLITHGLWQRVFAGRDDVIGQTLQLAGSRPIALEIVGVLPRGFVFPDFLNQPPIAIAPEQATAAQAARANYKSQPFVKLKPGVTDAEALATVQRAMNEVEASGPQYRQGRRTARMTPVRDALFSQVRRPLLMLLAVTALVALLAAANLAHLFLARTGDRMRELATRQALGASRGRLARMMLAEALLLASLGGIGALAAGSVMRDLVIAALPRTAHLYRAMPSAIDARVVVAIGALAAVALVVFGVVPAMAVVRRDPRGALTAATGPARSVARASLIFAQTTTAVAVLLTALLLTSSFTRLANQPLGYRPEGVSVATLLPSAGAPQDAAQLRHLNAEWKRAVERITGRRATLTDGLPGMTFPIGLGRLDQGRGQTRIIGYPVDADFFEVFDVRLVRGRLISGEEATSDQPVVVVDERAAAISWGAADPLGRELRDTSGVVRTVIGVVGALQTSLFSPSFQQPAAFVPLPAAPRRLQQVYWRGEVTDAMRRTMRETAAAVLPQAVASARPLELFGHQLGQARFLALLLGVLGLLAIALTVVGLYGVVSHGVSRRTREMGIRIALGAKTVGIARVIVLQTMLPAAAGVALGLAVSIWWAEGLRAMLYGSSPHDWRVFAGAGLAVLLLVVLACILPIRRATRVDPLIALKTE